MFTVYVLVAPPGGSGQVTGVPTISLRLAKAVQFPFDGVARIVAGATVPETPVTARSLNCIYPPLGTVAVDVVAETGVAAGSGVGVGAGVGVSVGTGVGVRGVTVGIGVGVTVWASAGRAAALPSPNPMNATASTIAASEREFFLFICI
jgi:hypothetical protein